MVSYYDVRILWNYINGYYLENVDELESDYRFMMDVIKMARDKNMYNLCSHDIKCNYDFVKFLILTFKDDKEFVHGVASYYLNNTNIEDVTASELVFIMCDILDKYKDNDKYLMYFVRRAGIVTTTRAYMYDFMSEEDFNTRKLLGMGFVLLLDSDFAGCSSIMKYVAEEFLYEIFYENEDLTLEELIHIRFSNVEKLDNYGIKNFIFSYVGEFDSFLSTYLSVNMDLIADLEKSIIRVRNNWDNYNMRMLERKYNIFIQEAFDYIDEYKPRYNYREICAYIDRLNVIPFKLEDTLYEEEVAIIDIKNIRLNDYVCIKKITELAKELFLSPVIDSGYYNKDNDAVIKNTGRILKFVPKRVDNIK